MKALPANGTGSTKSTLLVSRSTAAGLTVSVAVLLLLPLSPPAGFSTVVVVTLAVLPNERIALPGWKLARATTVTLCVSPLASVPSVQVKVSLPGARTAPAAIEQVEPPLLEAIERTVRPLSPPANVNTSASATPSAGDGPLLRYEMT